MKAKAPKCRQIQEQYYYTWESREEADGGVRKSRDIRGKGIPAFEEKACDSMADNCPEYVETMEPLTADSDPCFWIFAVPMIRQKTPDHTVYFGRHGLPLLIPTYISNYWYCPGP